MSEPKTTAAGRNTQKLSPAFVLANIGASLRSPLLNIITKGEFVA